MGHLRVLAPAFSRRNTLPVLLGATLAVAVGCSVSPKQKTLYWRGEMWDGMNRMVFALQDLDWHVDTVDTDTGRIAASIARDGKADADSDAEHFFHIIIRFSQDLDTPVAIEPDDKADEAYRSSRFLRKISKLTKRFEWYGGKSLEVIG